MKLLFRVFPVVILLLTTTNFIIAQTPHLDVEGEARILGKLELSHSLDTSSIIIGRNAGSNIDFGSERELTIVGVNAGLSNDIGYRNVFFGGNAGRANTDGHQNTFFGFDAGRSNTTGDVNSFFGTNAGLNNTRGEMNAFFGYSSGYNNSTGLGNTYIGYFAGYLNKGSQNTYIGRFAGVDSGINDLERSIAIGHTAKVGCSNCAVIGGTGVDTVHVGIGLTTPRAPLHLRRIGQPDQQTIVQILQSEGSQRPLLLFSENHPTGGLDDGMSLEYDGRLNTGDNKLNVNTTGGIPMVTFMNNGMVGIGTTSPNDALDVAGDIDASGCIQTGDANFIGGLCVSDRRLKKDIKDLEPQLHDLKALRPVTYRWRDPSRGTQEEIGLIAQEVEQVLPQMVVTESDGRKRIRYDLSLQIRLLKALQEQQAVIDQQASMLVDQTARIIDLQETVKEIAQLQQQVQLLTAYIQEERTKN